jgi:N-acetyl-anhydromuramyl-L-alanine amidase AmpD
MARPDVPIAKWVGLPKSYTSGRKSGQPSVIVIHTTEGSEGDDSAENGAAYDRRRTDGTSTHYFVDSNSIVQEVEHKDESHAARSKGNDIGIHVEICGRAGQTDAQWNDEDSAATLENVARLIVAIRKIGSFPLTRLSPADLRAGKRGICGHVDITNAFKESTHTDPGVKFPWSWLFKRVTELERGNVAKKKHTTADLDGTVINVVVFGDDDRDFDGYWAVQRLQRLLKYKADGKTPLEDDGRYGNDTRDAVKARMSIAGVKSHTGMKVALPEWKVFSGIFAG